MPSPLRRLKRVIAVWLVASLTSLALASAPLADGDVKIFTYRVLMALYEVKADQWLPQHKQAAKLFTGEGWSDFQLALARSKMMAVIKQQHYGATAVPLAPPTIRTQGLKRGNYHWQMTMPAMVVFKNSENQQVQYLNFSIDVVYQKGPLVNQVITTAGKPVNCQKTTATLEQSKTPH